MNNDSKRRMSKKSLIIAGSVASLVVLALIGVLIPTTMSDGTEAFSGEEKAAATSALSKATSSSAGIDKVNRLHELKVRVEQVKAVDLSAVGCDGSLPTSPKYVVVISKKTFFGIQSDLTVATPCAVMQGKPLETLYPNL